MLKHFSLMLLFSLALVLLQTELSYALHYLLRIHDHLLTVLSIIFSKAPAGRIIQETLALFLIPLGLGLIIGLVVFLIKRHSSANTTTTAWITWIILCSSLLAQPAFYHLAKPL